MATTQEAYKNAIMNRMNKTDETPTSAVVEAPSQLTPYMTGQSTVEDTTPITEVTTESPWQKLLNTIWDNKNARLEAIQRRL